MWFFVCANLSGNHPTCLDFQLWFFALIFYVFNIIQVHQHYWNHLHFAREWVAVTFTKDSSYHRLFFLLVLVSSLCPTQLFLPALLHCSAVQAESYSLMDWWPFREKNEPQAQITWTWRQSRERVFVGSWPSLTSWVASFWLLLPTERHCWSQTLCRQRQVLLSHSLCCTDDITLWRHLRSLERNRRCTWGLSLPLPAAVPWFHRKRSSAVSISMLGQDLNCRH